MFRPARWRSEKNKIKVVFRLQFHATQVSQVGIDALMISIIPAEFGKPTAKLEKAIVENGSCYWENAVFETVKFDREVKSGKIQERIYRFVVATGSSKAGVVGEASMDFSSYAEATKMSSVSLPLRNSKSEILLHVSIQRVHDSADQRESVESDTPKDNFQDKSLKAQLSDGDMGRSIVSNSMEDGTFNKNRRTSSGSDVTLSSFDSSSGLDSPRKLQLKNGNIHQDPTGLFSSLHHDSGFAVESSTDDSSSTPRAALQMMSSQEESDIVVEKLKSELAAVARQAEVSELELQSLRKQIVKESKRGQDLSKEVINLKLERDSLREDSGKLKICQKQIDEAKAKHLSQLEGGDLQALIEELRRELNNEKDLNAKLRIQLQKTQQSNSELILAVRDLDEMLEQKNKEMLHLSSKSATNDAGNLREANSKCEKDDDDEDQRALEQLVKEHSDAKEMYLMEQKIMDLHSEIEMYRREKDELEVQMEQLALDYEIMKQENHDMSHKLEQSQLQVRPKMQYECTSSYAANSKLESQIEKLESELKKREKECSESSATINELETHVKDLEEELDKQAQGFEADLEALTQAKVEQEQRAIRAEETLRKTRWQNANNAERLQEEFKRLSVQMSSTFEANEKLATNALTDANELRLQKHNLEDMLQKANEELESLKDHYEARIHELSNQVILLSEQIKQMQSEVEDKSLNLENKEKHPGIETLSTENKSLSERADRKEMLAVELESMRKSVTEMELQIEQGNKERTERGRVSMVKKESEHSLKELNHIRCLKGEKELILANLQAEVNMLNVQCDELRHSAYEDESEKEKLRNQVIQLKGELKKREDIVKNLEKKINDSNCKGASCDGVEPTERMNKSVSVPYGAKEIANLKEKTRSLEGQIKLKEASLETSTNIFLEKEKDLQNQIEELAKRLEVLHQNSAGLCEGASRKVSSEDIANCKRMEKARDAAECRRIRGPAAFISKENISTTAFLERNDDNLTDQEIKASAANSGHIDGLSNEVASLSERNKLMEDELKEMQERYSEISLKFAEVEGERQQLVMKLRSLKTAKKS